MNLTMDGETLALAAVLILALIAVGVWLWSRKEQSRRLEQRFGPEYARTVESVGDRDKAEAELRGRERRVQKLKLVPLEPAEAAEFSQAWKTLQLRFVDHPRDALAEADQLVRDLMLRRGYPMGDFEHRAADISVDHPAVVNHYRSAHAIAERDRHGEADTEDLRKAVVHCRALFDDLLQVSEPTDARAKDHMEVHS